MPRKRQPQERKLRTRAHVLADLSVNSVERQILLRGFAVNRMETDYGIDLLMLTYSNAGADTVITLVEKGPHEPVRITDAVSARRHLVEKGLITEEDLEAVLSPSATVPAKEGLREERGKGGSHSSPEERVAGEQFMPLLGRGLVQRLRDWLGW